MLSKNKIKLIRSLELKKKRSQERLFVAEGRKLVSEFLHSFRCRYLVATEAWINVNSALISELQARFNTEISCVEEQELAKVSFLDTPQEVLAVFDIPSYESDLENDVKSSLCLALDEVQNPGNLGTIIRIADWFGIENVYCSIGCADIYNPKCVQATMGAMARVKVHYVELKECLSRLDKGTAVYGTFLDGEVIYQKELRDKGLIIMGNEGKGISEGIAKHVTDRLFIPNFPAERDTSESLNVAVATAITCSEFRRRQLTCKTC